MRPSQLELVAVGLDHTTAGIEVREQFAFADGEIPAALRRLTALPDRMLDQAAILSTCNRVELYGVSRSRSAERQLTSFIAGYHRHDAPHVASMLRVYRGDEVARHLAATAAGMQSLVLGEVQILGQIHKALHLAVSAGTAGAELRRLFESAIAAGRRVRAETAIGRGAASVPSASVEFARRRLGTLSGSTVLLIGTGDVAQLAAKQVVKRGAKHLLVLGSAPRAQRLAECYGGLAITPDRLEEALAQSDVVISASGTPRPIVQRDQLRRALGRRGADYPALLLVDLSVPRDVDPGATELAGVEVRTIDDLRVSVEHALMQRRAELPDAHRILGSEVTRFTAWLRRRELTNAGESPGATRAQSAVTEPILGRAMWNRELGWSG